MGKKRATKKTTTPKAKKIIKEKKVDVSTDLGIVKDKQKRIDELDLKIENITLKTEQLEMGNKNDQIVANLLKKKASDYWGKQKEDLESL